MISRRIVLAGLAAPALAQAQDGVRALRIIVPFPPGGSVDFVSRLAQPRLQDHLGHPVVIENRGGAGGMLGSDAVARAAPDGSTVLWGNIATHAINPAVYDRMPYDPVADFAPVTLAAHIQFMLAVHPGVPAEDLGALVALARREPTRLSYGSAGPGSLPHLLTEMLKRAAGGIGIEHVPYRGGGPLITDLLSGTIQMTIADMAGLMPHVRAGRLRGIAVAAARRTQQAPDLPTIAETLPGVSATAWHGIFAPARTPAAAIARLNGGFAAALADPVVQERMRAAGTEPATGTPEELASLQRAEMAKWAEIARAVNARAS